MVASRRGQSITRAEIEFALSLAPALPLDPIDKVPLIARGYYGASVEAIDLARWWRKWPDALFALRTGLPGGIAVLDLDRATGQTSPLPTATRHVSTGHDPAACISSSSIGGDFDRRSQRSVRASMFAVLRAVWCGGHSTIARSCVRGRSRNGQRNYCRQFRRGRGVPTI